MSVNRKPLIAVVVASALGVTALAAYVRFVPKATGPTHAEVYSKPIVLPEPPKPANTKELVKVTIYNPTMSENGIVFTANLTEVPDETYPKMFAVAQFLQAAQITPDEAKLLGIQVIDGVAHLAFNREFDRTYGTFEEKSLIDGFAASLGQFPEINSFVLEIDGKVVPTLGSVDLSQPAPVTRPADVPLQKPTLTTDPPSDSPPADHLPATSQQREDPTSRPEASKDSESKTTSLPTQESTNIPPKTGPESH